MTDKLNTDRALTTAIKILTSGLEAIADGVRTAEEAARALNIHGDTSGAGTSFKGAAHAARDRVLHAAKAIDAAALELALDLLTVRDTLARVAARTAGYSVAEEVAAKLDAARDGRGELIMEGKKLNYYFSNTDGLRRLLKKYKHLRLEDRQEYLVKATVVFDEHDQAECIVIGDHDVAEAAVE